MERNKLGIYIHIPFCMQKCRYCGFLSFVGSNANDHRYFFNALEREIKEFLCNYEGEYVVDSVFVGGGTPSLPDSFFIARLMDGICNRFAVSDDCEISIESNPGTLTAYKLADYRSCGINRLSMGIQSLNDEILNSLGRIHDSREAVKSFEAARLAGFNNINTDIMFGIPRQNIGMWMDTVDRVIGMAPEHISFYSLQLEEGTPFYSQYKDGDLDTVTDEDDRNMYHSAIARLKESGYEHYEISNAARDGFQCRHNIKYWTMADYLGLGPGAHGFLNGMRYRNTSDMTVYLDGKFREDEYVNKSSDNTEEYIFTGLRMRRGIKLIHELKEKSAVIDDYVNRGYLEKTEDRLRLTEAGIDISNGIMADLI